MVLTKGPASLQPVLCRPARRPLGIDEFLRGGGMICRASAFEFRCVRVFMDLNGLNFTLVTT